MRFNRMNRGSEIPEIGTRVPGQPSKGRSSARLPITETARLVWEPKHSPSGSRKSPPASRCLSAEKPADDYFAPCSPLSWYGVRFYGAIDAGGGNQTHGAPLNPYFAQGSSYLVQKMDREAMWTLAPGALSTSAAWRQNGACE